MFAVEHTWTEIFYDDVTLRSDTANNLLTFLRVEIHTDGLLAAVLLNMGSGAAVDTRTI
jgi:hypothetical protein